MLDAAWMRERLELARRRYGAAPDRVLGTVWWYSASAVWLGPAMRGVFSEDLLDPALNTVFLRILPDGVLIDAWALQPFDGDIRAFAERLAGATADAVSAVSAACGAAERALWAIATDSLANQLLFAGQAAGDLDRAVSLADTLADLIGPVMPRPRFTRIGPHLVVRRASCCLIDRTPRGEICASCPHQRPDERDRRIRSLLS